MDDVADHFRVHRWERPVPRLSVIATVDNRIRLVAKNMQRSLSGAPVSLIPSEWLHVTVVTLGSVDKIVPATYRAWRAVVAAGAAAAKWGPLELGAARVGRTGVSVGLFGDTDAMTMVGQLSRDAALRTGIPVAGPVPTSPHLGLAYMREDRSEQRLQMPPSPTGSASWRVNTLQVVHLVQDVKAGFYWWTVVDELQLDNLTTSGRTKRVATAGRPPAGRL